MKSIIFRANAVALWVFFLPLGESHGGDGKAVVDDCAAVGREIGAAVAKNRAAVLPIVGKAVVENEDCICEVVKAAILGVESDPEMVREIVITAVTAVEHKAAEIAECAVTTAPEAVDAIKSALSSVFGDPPYVGTPVSIHGIFLIPPETTSPANPSP